MAPEAVARLNLGGCAFLHQQGRVVCRGWVDRCVVEPGRWSLYLRSISHLDRLTRRWVKAKAKDEYGSVFSDAHSPFRRDVQTRILTISGYGMVTHIAPRGRAPWRRVDWPSTDSYPGGTMADFLKEPRGPFIWI